MTTSIDLDTLSVTDEIDLTNDGLPNREMVLTISNVEKQETNGNERVAITYEGSELPFPVTVRYWTKHTSEGATQAGRGALKKITIAATGSPKFSPSALLGRQIRGTPSEDKGGFPRINSVKSVDSASVAE